jgi:hypothetical protein
MPTTDRVAGHHRDHRLRSSADLHLQVEHVEPADALTGHRVVAEVAVVAADALVATGTEREVALPGQDDDADRVVVAGQVERVLQLEQGLRAERVAHLRPVYRDLGDPLGHLVPDVPVVTGRRPIRAWLDRAGRRIDRPAPVGTRTAAHRSPPAGPRPHPNR